MAANTSIPMQGVAPQINTTGAAFQGMNAAAQIDMAQKQAAEKGMQIIGSAALGAMNGDINGRADPEKFDAILTDLERMGVSQASLFRGKPELAPVIARASMTALQSIGAANDAQRLQLAMDQFGQQVLNANRAYDLDREKFEFAKANANAPAGPASPLGKLEQDFRNGLISEADYRAAVEKATTQSGGITVEPDGTISIGGGKLTGEQAKTAGYAQRMVNAEGELAQSIDAAQPNMASKNPLSGDFWQMLNREYGPNMTQSPEYQRYKNAAMEWIRAKLRKESGAAISAQEWESEFTTYFPQPGDAPEVMQQKERLRQNAIESLRVESRGGYDMLFKQRGDGGATTQMQPSGTPEITTKEQYDALPSGAEFMWNGKRGRKP